MTVWKRAGKAKDAFKRCSIDESFVFFQEAVDEAMAVRAWIRRKTQSGIN